jgi:hypothetical protein
MSSSSSNSSSDESSSSSLVSKKSKSSCNFKVSKSQCRILQKWQVSTIDTEEAKLARERYVPSFKLKETSLTVAELDNSFYEKLKEAKRSQASKANIEPEEKPWRQLHFKLADLGKPLLYLTRTAIKGDRRRSKRTAKEEAIASRHALKLYAILLAKVKFMRRSIFMRQLFPRYQHLLKTSTNLDDKDSLFGPKFVKEMKTEAETESALEKANEKESKFSYMSDSRKQPYKKYKDGYHDRYESFLPLSNTAIWVSKELNCQRSLPRAVVSMYSSSDFSLRLTFFFRI